MIKKENRTHLFLKQLPNKKNTGINYEEKYYLDAHAGFIFGHGRS
jgi:hypothetical protein